MEDEGGKGGRERREVEEKGGRQRTEKEGGKKEKERRWKRIGGGKRQRKPFMSLKYKIWTIKSNLGI